jgi:uncharacterized protein YdeI (YjbR/CyaY-like superfamily)
MPEAPADSIHPKSALAWRTWLEPHHARGQGVWLISYKLAAGKPRMAYDEAVATALCFGWIDSKPRALDQERSMLWFAPRKKGSAWSKKNKERVEQLLRAKLMKAGLQHSSFPHWARAGPSKTAAFGKRKLRCNRFKGS